jgi:hypothetical protein
VQELRGFASAPLTDLFAVVFAEIQQLNAGLFAGFVGPDHANIHLHGLRKAAERDSNARNKVARERNRRRNQEAVFTYIEEQAVASFVDSDVDRRMRGDARVKTPLDTCRFARKLLR